MAIVIKIGRGTPSAEIRLRRNGGLAVEVVGHDRNWVAGLRQQLEAALKPTRRLHAPLGSDPINFAWAGMVGFSWCSSAWTKPSTTLRIGQSQGAA
jgi:hypothetical protein